MENIEDNAESMKENKVVIKVVVNPGLIDYCLKNPDEFPDSQQRAQEVYFKIQKLIDSPNCYVVDGMNLVPEGLPQPRNNLEISISGAMKSASCTRAKSLLEQRGYNVRFNDKACL